MKNANTCTIGRSKFGEPIGFTCAICGSRHETIRFRNNRICKDCLHYIKHVMTR